MSEAIIVALVTGVCAVVAQLIISNRSSKDLYAKLDKQSELANKDLDAKLQKYQAVTDTKIDVLASEVREHNQYAKRMPVVEEQIKVINHRIEDLERLTNSK